MLRLSSPLQLQQVWERPKASPPPSSPIRSADEQDGQEEAEAKQYASSIVSNAVSETQCSVVASIEIPIPPPRPAPMVPPKDVHLKKSARGMSHSNKSSCSSIHHSSNRSIDTQEQRQSFVPPVMHDSSSADGTTSFCSSSNVPPTPTSAMHSKSKDCLSSGIPPPPPIPNMESTISSTREDGGSLRRAASRLSLKRRGFSKKIKKVLSFQKKRQSTVF
ncbi:hypothetical protein LRAMOSA00012 [Lichtheimia ramosa]|uniref:Uncharacterized protein n=1 Tax=Lichtheimia ramosa TaxID=688394 RepID=A0A077W5H5_9FUNG|nr:hypothetical protein LRAMOSA00012 [Lichtheimia ramosa]